MVKNYIPNAGDIVWIDFNPTRGHEQSKSRPALILSATVYNKKTGMAILCPITSVAKGYPFEVTLKSKKIEGVVLADQVRALDWKERGVKFCTKAKDSELNEVREKSALLI